MSKKIGLKLGFKNNLKWKGIPEVGHTHKKSLRWLLQQKFVSRPQSSPKNIRTDKLSQIRRSNSMKYLKGVQLDLKNNTLTDGKPV